MVQKIAQSDAARFARDTATEHAIQEIARIYARHFKSVETVHLLQSDTGLQSANFFADHVMRLVKSEAVGFLEIRCGLEIIGALPAIHDRELGPFSGQDRRQRRGFDRTTRGAMFMWEVEAELVLVVFNRFEGGELDIAVTCEPPRIEDPGVIAGFTMHNLLGEQPAMTAPFTQAGAQSDDTKCVALARDRPNQGRAVDCICDRSIDDGFDADIHQSWHAGKGPFHHVHDAVEIIGTEIVRKLRIDPVHAPSLTILFIEADQQPVLFLTGVVIADRTTQERHPVPCIDDPLDVFGHHILVLH